MSKGELRVKSGISTRQLAKLGKNESVSTQVLVKICKILGCTVDEIMDMIEKKEENEKGDIES
jgi:DNA-binding Xre family transcriptional regulator